MLKFPRYLLILFFISIALVSCSPLIRPEQSNHTEIVSLKTGTSIGQTFFARHRGLSGIEVFIEADQPVSGELKISLFDGSGKEYKITQAQLPLVDLSSSGYYQFDFQPQIDSFNHDYYLEIISTSSGAVDIGVGPGDSYLDGALYQNNTPQDLQLAFNLVYDPGQVIFGLFQLGYKWLGIVLVAGFLFILPGWALLAYLEPGWGLRSWGEKLGLSAGLSLALYPILFLWTDVINLHLGALYAWLPLSIGLGALIWRNRRWRPSIDGQRKLAIETSWLRAVNPADVAFVIIIILIIGTRFWVIRTLEIPLWGDSYHHTMIAQLLVDNGGLFNSWEPYAELETFTYHFGFHTLVAVFHWITDFQMPQATLWTGQIINALAVISLYPLAIKVGNNRWAGVLTVLLAGLLFSMPMYYVNWGRYTQLAGQVILPTLAYLAWITFELNSNLIRSIVLSIIGVGGLALTHYRVLIFAILFLMILLVFNLSKGKFKTLFFSFVLIGIGGGILFSPWFIHILSGKIVSTLAQQVSTPAGQITGFTQQYNAIGNLSFYLPTPIWMLFALACGWGLWRRDKGATIIVLWSFLVLLATNPEWVRLPGTGAIGNFTVFIAAYIPASIILGSGVSWLVENCQSSFSKIEFKREKITQQDTLTAVIVAPLIQNSGYYSLLVMIAIAGLWGAHLRIKDISPAQNSLITRPDLRAAAWIRANTPPNSRFLVNSFFAYGGEIVVGSDGGWWLPLLTGRQSNLPPINYVSERTTRPDYSKWVNDLTEQVQSLSPNDPEFLRNIKKRGITYIYIGQRQGRVNSSGPFLETDQILQNPHYQTVYHQDQVWIFAVN
jgi:hypothetical protein